MAFALEHGQRLCKLTFERMKAAPDEAYGTSIGSRYQSQQLALGRQFKPDKQAKRSRSDELSLFPDLPLPISRAVDDSTGLVPTIANERDPSAASRNERHIVASRGGWAIESPGDQTENVVFPLQSEAIDAAREIVRSTGGGLLAIHNRQGLVRKSDIVRPAPEAPGEI